MGIVVRMPTRKGSIMHDYGRTHALASEILRREIHEGVPVTLLDEFIDMLKKKEVQLHAALKPLYLSPPYWDAAAKLKTVPGASLEYVQAFGFLQSLAYQLLFVVVSDVDSVA